MQECESISATTHSSFHVTDAMMMTMTRRKVTAENYAGTRTEGGKVVLLLEIESARHKDRRRQRNMHVTASGAIDSFETHSLATHPRASYIVPVACTLRDLCRRVAWQNNPAHTVSPACLADQRRGPICSSWTSDPDTCCWLNDRMCYPGTRFV